MASRREPTQGGRRGRPKRKLKDALTSTPTTLRVCLKCDEEFESLGPQNRLCSICNASNFQALSRSPEDRGRWVIRKNVNGHS